MNRTVLILGGGVAGIAAALRLSAQGYRVTMVEAAPHLGGRLVAPRPDSASATSTNPIAAGLPLVLFGCHTATWSLLEFLGTAEHIRRQPSCALKFLLTDGRRVRLSPGLLPAPFHIVKLLLGFRGLPWKDRWRLLNFLERMWEHDIPLPSDLENRTAAKWLADIGQSSTACDNVWAPLSRFLLGDGLERVSASMFAGTLHRHYLAHPGQATVSAPSSPIQQLLLDPAYRHMTHAGVRLRLGTTIAQLRFNRERVTGVQLQDGSPLTADWYVVALPYDRLQALLPERIVTHYATFEHLGHLRSVPGLVLHLRVNASIRSPRVILLVDRAFHWMIVRPAPSPGDGGTLVALMCVGNHERLAQSDEDILLHARRDLTLADASLGNAALNEWGIVRHPQAFLSMEPGSRPYRPLQQTPFENLLLAGDWTETGWPSTIESAVLSGNRCAELIATSAARDGVASATTQTGSQSD